MEHSPSSLCELMRWIIEWPPGRALAAWNGNTVEPSVETFTKEFTRLVNNLGCDVSTLPMGASLFDMQVAAQQVVTALIFSKHEVPHGWKSAFTDRVPIPGYGPICFLPSHPIRSAVDVLRFMDQKREQATMSANRFPPDVNRSLESVQTGIKGAWVWLVAEGHDESTSMLELPDDLLALSDLFNDVYKKVKSAKTLTPRDRTVEPNEADLHIARLVFDKLKTNNPKQKSFNDVCRDMGYCASNVRLNAARKAIIAERKK